MRNIHILPTDKETRLFIANGKLFNYHKHQQGDGVKVINQNIYITSDEEIKEGDWYILHLEDRIVKRHKQLDLRGITPEFSKKIILTTDQDLIKDGVQAISDEFLEWFVKNPSCEEIEINYEIYKKGIGLITSDWRMSKDDKYKIIIPEGPKEEVTDLSTIENKIIECLNEAGDKLDVNDFDILAESIVDYINEIGRSKN